jgi:hypothetical protein
LAASTTERFRDAACRERVGLASRRGAAASRAAQQRTVWQAVRERGFGSDARGTFGGSKRDAMFHLRDATGRRRERGANSDRESSSEDNRDSDGDDGERKRRTRADR